jgi:hypothetical protein
MVRTPRSPRCPYCVSFDQFMLMRALDEKSYVCDNCGHVVVPDNRVFCCPCNHCEEMRSFTPLNGRNWTSASA